MRTRRLTIWIASSVLFLSVGWLPGQSPKGTITGTVTDAQQRRIPGVEVAALHVATNQTYTSITSEAGVYAIPSLPVGRFEVTASLPGFKTFKQTNTVLEVGQRLRLDIQLEIGEVSSTITVSSTVSRVQTEDSSLGRSFRFSFPTLKGDRKGQYSIRINDQWRVCFQWPAESPGPANVEIVDYH